MFYGPLFLLGRESLWFPIFKSSKNKEEGREKEDKTYYPDMNRARLETNTTFQLGRDASYGYRVFFAP